MGVGESKAGDPSETKQQTDVQLRENQSQFEEGRGGATMEVGPR